MADQQTHLRINDYLLDLFGDPLARVYDACEPHRENHGRDCGVYPATPQKMQVLSILVGATGARTVLEIGGGLGYSALWLSSALPVGARLQTIDRFPEHARLIEDFAGQYGLADRIEAIVGEGIDVLQQLPGPYDIIHDDGWFGEQPAYYDRMVELIRPGGLLILANCFLLEHAVSGEPRNDWSQFAGPDWAGTVQAYASRLASDSRLRVSFVFRPAWVGLGWKVLSA